MQIGNIWYEKFKKTTKVRFFALISRMWFVNRWALMRTSVDENLSSEITAGDVPTPVKYSSLEMADCFVAGTCRRQDISVR